MDAPMIVGLLAFWLAANYALLTLLLYRAARREGVAPGPAVRASLRTPFSLITGAGEG